MRNALANFTLNSFHVLLAALWGSNDPDQVFTEHWEANGKRYTAYIGNFGTRSGEQAMPDIPSDLFPRILETIQQESLPNDVHWFRFFFANLQRDVTYEALKDNEIWEAGLPLPRNNVMVITRRLLQCSFIHSRSRIGALILFFSS